MEKVMLILVALATLAKGQPERVSYEGYDLIMAIQSKEEDLEFMRTLQSTEVDFWSEPTIMDRPVTMLVSPKGRQDLVKQLEERGIMVSPMVDSVQVIIEDERENLIQDASSVQETGFDFKKYHNLPEIYSFMENLTEHYPEITELDSIGTSYQNRSIQVLKIGAKKDKDKPLIVVECGMHSREWITTMIGTFIMNELVTNYGVKEDVTQLVDKFEFIIIPVANPDGLYYSFTVDRLWRKTMSVHSTGCIGVDGNRNFDIDFCDKASSTDPCSNLYCGPEPFSESETRAIRDLLLQNKERVAAFFDVHAFRQTWMIPYQYKADKPSNYDELYRIGEIGVKALRNKYGMPYDLSTAIEATYPASGTATDYAYEKVGIPIVYHLEVQDRGLSAYLLPRKFLKGICKETYIGIMAAVNALSI